MDEYIKVKKDWRGEQGESTHHDYEYFIVAIANGHSDIRRHYQDEVDRAQAQLQIFQRNFVGLFLPRLLSGY
jgi:hypothetical protein